VHHDSEQRRREQVHQLLHAGLNRLRLLLQLHLWFNKVFAGECYAQGQEDRRCCFFCRPALWNRLRWFLRARLLCGSRLVQYPGAQTLGKSNDVELLLSKGNVRTNQKEEVGHARRSWLHWLCQFCRLRQLIRILAHCQKVQTLRRHSILKERHQPRRQASQLRRDWANHVQTLRMPQRQSPSDDVLRAD
jgi:hypothetical protein